MLCDRLACWSVGSLGSRVSHLLRLSLSLLLLLLSIVPLLLLPLRRSVCAAFFFFLILTLRATEAYFVRLAGALAAPRPPFIVRRNRPVCDCASPHASARPPHVLPSLTSSKAYPTFPLATWRRAPEPRSGPVRA